MLPNLTIFLQMLQRKRQKIKEAADEKFNQWLADEFEKSNDEAGVKDVDLSDGDKVRSC